MPNNLADIKAGSLGKGQEKHFFGLGQEYDYAQRAKDICDFDYTKAKERGASDLCNDLKKMLAAKARTKEEAKRIIDSIYARLRMYSDLGEKSDYKPLREGWEDSVMEKHKKLQQ